MRTIPQRAGFALAVAGLAACADTAPNPVALATPPAGPRLEAATPAWTLSDLDAEFGGRFSWDTTRSQRFGDPEPHYFELN